VNLLAYFSIGYTLEYIPGPGTIKESLLQSYKFLFQISINMLL